MWPGWIAVCALGITQRGTLHHMILTPTSLLYSLVAPAAAALTMWLLYVFNPDLLRYEHGPPEAVRTVKVLADKVQDQLKRLETEAKYFLEVHKKALITCRRLRNRGMKAGAASQALEQQLSRSEIAERLGFASPETVRRVTAELKRLTKEAGREIVRATRAPVLQQSLPSRPLGLPSRLPTPTSQPCTRMAAFVRTPPLTEMGTSPSHCHGAGGSERTARRARRRGARGAARPRAAGPHPGPDAAPLRRCPQGSRPLQAPRDPRYAGDGLSGGAGGCGE